MSKVNCGKLLLVLLLLPVAISAKSSVQDLKSMKFGPKEAPQIIEKIIEKRAESVPELIEMLKDTKDTKKLLMSRDDLLKEKYARITAINLLGELQEKESLNSLKLLLMRSENPSYIFNSARAIGNIGGLKAFKILSKALIKSSVSKKSNSIYIKKASILGLGLCGSKLAIPLLTKELNDHRNEQIIRIYAAGSLGLLGSDRGLYIAQDGLTSSDAQVKMRSIQALGLIGNDISNQDLEYFIGEKTKYSYRKAAKLAISQIKYRKMKTGEKVKFLKDILKRYPKRAAYINWGMRKLSKMKTKESTKALTELSKEEKTGYRFLKQAARIKLKLNK